MPRLWFAGDVAFAELDELVKRFNVRSVVIDAFPETLAATQFAKATWVPGRVGTLRSL